MRVFKCIVRGRSILSALCIFHNYLLFWRCVTISSKELQINDEIRDKELRIIDTDGSQLGIMSASEALDKAAEKNLDLVKILNSTDGSETRLAGAEFDLYKKDRNGTGYRESV